MHKKTLSFIATEVERIACMPSAAGSPWAISVHTKNRKEVYTRNWLERLEEELRYGCLADMSFI